MKAMNDDQKRALALLCRATHEVGDSLVLRAGGAELTQEKRAELLARAMAGELVELELDVLAYTQRPGEPNRNFVRFRDGAMMALGRSGRGKPFLRDHQQYDVTKRGGTILESVTEKRGDGDYVIRMRVRLTAPWAVELALRDLLSFVSIGWHPTGPIECSACNAPIFSQCSHWPGERLSEMADEGGAKRKVRDRNGSIVVEWVYTSAELVECSACNVPGVRDAEIEGIRAALAAHFGGMQPREGDEMLLTRLTSILGLAATASDDDVVRAVESQRSRLQIAEDARDEAVKRALAAEAGLAAANELVARQQEDEFVLGGLLAGKINPGSKFETSLRAFWRQDAKGAEALLADAPVINPVGKPRQTAPGPAGTEAQPKLSAVDERIRAYNPAASLEGVAAVLAACGYSNPNELVAKHLGKEG